MLRKAYLPCHNESNVNFIFSHNKTNLIIPNFTRSCRVPENSLIIITYNTSGDIQDAMYQPIQFSWILTLHFNLI